MGNVILSLKKECEKIKKSNVDIGKISIDLNKDSTVKIIEKVRKRIEKNLNIEQTTYQRKSAKEIQEFFDNRWEYIKVKIKDIPEQSIRIINSMLGNLKKEYIKDSSKCLELKKSFKGFAIEFSYNGKDLNSKGIFTAPGLSFTPSIYKYYFKNKGNIMGERYDTYKLYDFTYLVSLGDLLEMCYKYFSTDNSIFLSAKNSFFEKNYSEFDLDNLFDVISELDSGYMFHKNINTSFVLTEALISIGHIQSSMKLTTEYRDRIKGEYAKSFETKKNIPEKFQKVMKESPLLKSFSFVEIDETTDIEKFRMIEQEFEKTKKLLKLRPFIKNKPEFRVRRLGQHNASGLYYPDFKCICIDVNTPASFMHELGHHIDRTFQKEDMSLDIPFQKIAIEYKKKLSEEISECDDEAIKKYFKGKKNYYFTPTEIFARSLEMYLVYSKNIKSSFLPSLSKMELIGGYPLFNGRYRKMVEDYFSEIFDIEDNIDTTVEIKAPTRKTVSKKKIEVNDLEPIVFGEQISLLFN